MLKTTEDYLKANKRHGLKNGEKDKVIRAAKNYEKGWENIWNPIMNRFVGKILTINDTGKAIKKGLFVEGTHFAFPHFVLRRVKC